MSKKAYILIDAEIGQAEAVALALDGKPGILAADVILGTHDVVAVVEGANADAVAKTVLSQITSVDGIVRTTTCLVVSGDSGKA